MVRSIRLALLGALLCVPVFGTMTASAAAVPVSVTVKCYASPEKTTITNIGTSSVKITSFGSTYQAYPGEPFRINKTLTPSQSISYFTGRGSSFYGNSIYNDNGRDGVRVVSSSGTITKHC